MKRLGATILSLLLGIVAVAQPKSTKVDSPAISRWKTLVPAIEATLRRNGQTCPREWKPSIIDAADFSSGVSVALVDWCAGGAYTDYISAMNIEGAQPVLSRVRRAKEDIGFLQGASVKHGADSKLVPEKNAIYSIRWESNDRLRLIRCDVYAYVWNNRTRTFDWNRQLTKEATRNYCEELQGQMLKERARDLPPTKY